MNWLMVLIGALGTTALRYFAGRFLSKPGASPAKALPPSPAMLENFESMLCRRGISIRSARALVAAGFDNFAALEEASDTELLAIKGVGPETVKKIRSFVHYNPHQFEGELA